MNIDITVQEFEKFIEFVETEKPKLSAKLGVFGKKDSFKLNHLLHYKRDVSKPHYFQDHYPILDLMFFLALEGNLHVKSNDDKGKSALAETTVMESFKNLNKYEKYVYLLQTYWTKYEFIKKGTISIYVESFLEIFDLIAKAQEGTRIESVENSVSRRMYSQGAYLFHHLRFFGLGEIEEIPRVSKSSFEDSIKAFIPNELGIHISKFLLEKALTLWNCKSPWDNFLDKKEYHSANNPFDVFKEVFPGGKVTNTVIHKSKIDRKGVYTFKVSLSGWCWRKICFSHRHSLSDVHDAIQEAFDFGDDHLYAFYIGGNHRTGKPIYCMEFHELGIPAEETTIEDLGLYKGQEISYLFDFGDMWEFRLHLVDIDKDAPLPLKPEIIEKKGEAPQQYPVWDE